MAGIANKFAMLRQVAMGASSISQVPVILIGSGRHAGVLIDALHATGREVAFATDASDERHGKSVLGVEVRGSDDLILECGADEIELVNAIGSVDVPSLRARVFLNWFSRGYRFANVIHPSSLIGSDVTMGEGALIMAGTVLQYGTTLGDNVLINTGAQIDHTCVIGEHSQIAPAVNLCGDVSIGARCHIGAGATVVQGVRVGDESVVGAGGVVIRDLPAGSRCAGVPVHPI